MIEVFLILSVLTNIALMFFWIRSTNTKNKLIATTTKMLIDNAALEKIIKEDLDVYKNDQEVHKENFIKFLSESRDWAFTYIEEVQSSLQEFVSDIEPEINYFKEYGDVASMQPNYYSLKKITEAYDKLAKLLPRED